MARITRNVEKTVKAQPEQIIAIFNEYLEETDKGNTEPQYSSFSDLMNYYLTTKKDGVDLIQNVVSDNTINLDGIVKTVAGSVDDDFSNERYAELLVYLANNTPVNSRNQAISLNSYLQPLFEKLITNEAYLNVEKDYPDDVEKVNALVAKNAPTRHRKDKLTKVGVGSKIWTAFCRYILPIGLSFGAGAIAGWQVAANTVAGASAFWGGSVLLTSGMFGLLGAAAATLAVVTYDVIVPAITRRYYKKKGRNGNNELLLSQIKGDVTEANIAEVASHLPIMKLMKQVEDAERKMLTRKGIFKKLRNSITRSVNRNRLHEIARFKLQIDQHPTKHSNILSNYINNFLLATFDNNYKVTRLTGEKLRNIDIEAKHINATRKVKMLYPYVDGRIAEVAKMHILNAEPAKQIIDASEITIKGLSKKLAKAAVATTTPAVTEEISNTTDTETDKEIDEIAKEVTGAVNPAALRSEVLPFGKLFEEEEEMIIPKTAKERLDYQWAVINKNIEDLEYQKRESIRSTKLVNKKYIKLLEKELVQKRAELKSIEKNLNKLETSQTNAEKSAVEKAENAEKAAVRKAEKSAKTAQQKIEAKEQAKVDDAYNLEMARINAEKAKVKAEKAKETARIKAEAKLALKKAKLAAEAKKETTTVVTKATETEKPAETKRTLGEWYADTVNNIATRRKNKLEAKNKARAEVEAKKLAKSDEEFFKNLNDTSLEDLQALNKKLTIETAKTDDEFNAAARKLNTPTPVKPITIKKTPNTEEPKVVTTKTTKDTKNKPEAILTFPKFPEKEETKSPLDSVVTTTPAAKNQQKPADIMRERKAKREASKEKAKETTTTQPVEVEEVVKSGLAYVDESSNPATRTDFFALLRKTSEEQKKPPVLETTAVEVVKQPKKVVKKITPVAEKTETATPAEAVITAKLPEGKSQELPEVKVVSKDTTTPNVNVTVTLNNPTTAPVSQSSIEEIKTVSVEDKPVTVQYDYPTKIGGMSYKVDSQGRACYYNGKLLKQPAEDGKVRQMYLDPKTGGLTFKKPSERSFTQDDILAIAKKFNKANEDEDGRTDK